MPLILVTGLPSSGKSKTSSELCNFFQNKLKETGDSRHVRIVSDGDNLDWDGRNEIYMSIPKEKELRGWLRAEAQRYINLNQIVILDSAAYIKGFRYELFCMSKEARTQYCVVEKLLDQEICWKWNEMRVAESDEDQQLCYNRETFDALVLRYEKCDVNNRWDSPLFRITREDERLPFEEVFKAITEVDPLSANKCTLTTTTTSTIYKPTN